HHENHEDTKKTWFLFVFFAFFVFSWLTSNDSYCLVPPDAGSSRIRILWKATSSPWSCSWMCPFSLVPHPGSSLNLLLAFAAMSAALPSSYSSTFAPFSQCSTWLPLTRMRLVLISPAGFALFV